MADLTGLGAPWGTAPTPLLPSLFRDLMRGERAPSSVRAWVGDDALTCEQLGRDIWQRTSSPLPQGALQDVGALVASRLERVAPLSTSGCAWSPTVDLKSLPLRERTRNAVLRRLISDADKSDWLAYATVGDLLRIRNFGVMSLLDLLCVLESAVEAEANEQTGLQLGGVALPHVPARPNGLDLVAAWALGEHGAATIGELLPLADVPKPAAVERAWQMFLAQPLAVLGERHAGQFSVTEHLREVLASLDEREMLILQRRIVVLGRPATLDELGGRIGVTRERVRQVEHRVTEALHGLLDGPVGRRAASVASRLGTAVPLDSPEIDNVVSWATRDIVVLDASLAGGILLYLSGPYGEDDGWLVRTPDRQILAATGPLLLSAVDDDDILHDEQIARILTEASIREPFHQEWIDHLGTFRRTTRGLLRWDGSTLDKLHRLLRLRGIPSTTEELLADLGENLNPRGVRQRLMDDPRFVRVNLRGEFALPDWGYDEYTGIADEIAEELARRGGTATVSELVARLVERFGVAENSVRMYVQTPRFVVDGGTVRLRRPDEPYEVAASIAEARGCFQLSPDSLAWLLNVDADVLRGSGRAIPVAIATFLGVDPGGERRLTPRLSGSTAVTTVPVTWNPVSTAGPAIGSLRSLALHLKAESGSLVRLTFDRDKGTLSGTRIVPTDLGPIPPLARIATLTGLTVDGADPADVLAAALGVPKEAVRRTLRSRGDGQIADWLPEVMIGADLDAALDDLSHVL